MNNSGDESRPDLPTTAHASQDEFSQLQQWARDLELTNRRLLERIDGAETAALGVDRDFRIRWYTPAVASFFSLDDSCVGRPVAEVCSVVDGAPINDGLESVFASDEAIQDEIQCAGGQWFLRRILPNLPDPNSVVVTLTDITEHKRQQALAETEREKLLATLERRVEQRTAQLRVLSFELARSEERERREVATDLHDGLGQILALTKMKLDALLDKADGDVAAGLVEVEALVDESFRAVRSLVRQLSPPALYDAGLIPAIEVLIEEMRSHYGLQCELTYTPYKGRIDEPVRIVLFRAVRELLINAARHADANLVHVDITAMESGNPQPWVRVVVTDDGDGFDVEQVLTDRRSGFGLTSIQERLSYIGGEVDIASNPGDGTTVTLIAPFRFSDEH